MEKYLKAYTGVSSGSFMGRDDGYDEEKYDAYSNFGMMASKVGTRRNERFYKLLPIDMDKVNSVDNIITYIDDVDDIIFEMIQRIGDEKGYRITNDVITNEMLIDIRAKLSDTIHILTGGVIDFHSYAENITVENSTISEEDKAAELVTVENSTISEEDKAAELVTVENKTLTDEDELLLTMLFDIGKNEAQHCLDLGYNSENTWTVNERLEDLANFFLSMKGKTIDNLINDYGIDFFKDGTPNFKETYANLFPSYEVGSEFNLIYTGVSYQYRFTIVRIGRKYGALRNFNSVLLCTVDDEPILHSTIRELIKEISLEGEVIKL